MHDDLRSKIDEAAKTFERAKRSLLRPDGQSKFSIPEHNELEGIAKSNFNSELGRIEDEIEGRIASAEEKLHRMEHSDPSAVLTAEELEQANARRAFVSDEVFGRSAQALEDRVRAVIASSDRPAMFLYAHYLRAKTSEDIGDRGLVPDAEQLRLGELVRELESALDPQAAARVERAQAEIKELRGLKDYVYLRKNGATDPVQLYMDRAYGSATR
jgi:hypothetical protein